MAQIDQYGSMLKLSYMTTFKIIVIIRNIIINNIYNIYDYNNNNKSMINMTSLIWLQSQVQT
jgi:hypothetical protein